MKPRISLGAAVGLALGIGAIAAGSAGAATPAKAAASKAPATAPTMTNPPVANTTSAMPKVTAVLDAAHVVPPPATSGAGATGYFTGFLDGTILRYSFTFGKLSGRAEASQIRIGGPKASGPIAQALCDPCATPEAGVVPLYPAQLAALKAGRLYVVIETAEDVDGEIRGQLVLSK